MALAERETAAEHIRNAMQLAAFDCADPSAILARLRAALRELEGGNVKNPGKQYAVLARQRGGKRRFLVAYLTGSTAGGGPIYQLVRDKLTQQEASALVQQLTGKNPPTRKAQRFISRKIRTLAHEGMRAPRRVAGAYSLARRAGFRVPKKARRNPSEGIAWSTVRAFAHHITQSFRHPVSVKQDAEEIMRIADDMLTQLRAGVHENPTLAVLGNPPVAGTLSDHTYGGSIKYKHKEDGKRYIHHFGSGARILLLRDGSIQLKHPTKRLWEDM